jgi:hypothetical protein
MGESEKVDEQLTEEERENLEHGFKRRSSEALIAKLLRIHDALQARVEELERDLKRPRLFHLNRIPSLEERRALMEAAPGICPVCGLSPPD